MRKEGLTCVALISHSSVKHTLDHMGFDDEIVALRADLETVAEKIKLCQEMIQVGLSLEDGLGEVLGFLESCQTRIPALVKAGGEGLLSEDVFARVLQVNDALTATLEFEKNGTSLDKVASKATNNITNNSSSNVNIGSSNKSQANVGKSYAASQDLLHFDNNGSGLLPPPRSASGSGAVQGQLLSSAKNMGQPRAAGSSGAMQQGLPKPFVPAKVPATNSPASTKLGSGTSIAPDTSTQSTNANRNSIGSRSSAPAPATANLLEIDLDGTDFISPFHQNTSDVNNTVKPPPAPAAASSQPAAVDEDFDAFLERLQAGSLPKL